MFRKVCFRGTAVITCGGCMTSTSYLEKDDNSLLDVSNLTKRLKVAYPADKNNQNLICRKELNESVQLFSLKQSRLNFPNCFVATCEIQAPIEEVCSLWVSQDRPSWESQYCANTQLISNPTMKMPIYYVLMKPSYFAPSRDFAFSMEKISGGVVGLTDYRSVVFVLVNQSNEVPTSWLAVRSKRNGLLIVEPKSALRTKVTYVVEIDDGGWFHPYVIDWFADYYFETLVGLKKEIEKSRQQENEKGKTIDEIAKMRFQKQQQALKKQNSTSIVDDITANKEDLVNTVHALEKRLVDIRKAENTDGLDLRELRSRVESDLRKARERLQV